MFITLMLSSCASFRRETRFVDEEWPKEAKNDPYINREFSINELPRIVLSSHCVSESSLSFGPYIGLPLPVIPNPFWPFQYYSYSKFPAALFLTIEAPPNTLNWEVVNINLSVNGNLLKDVRWRDHSNVWKQSRVYTYDLKIPCGQFEDAKITVNVDGLPGSIKSTILYMHRWRIEAAP